MLAIRLARVGKKKQPTYRLTVSEKSKDTFGDFLEIVGYYNPRSKVCEVKKDRILHWISKGAQPSSTVHNLLIDQNVIEGEKVKASKAKKKGKKGEEEKKESPAVKVTAEKTEEKKDPSTGSTGSQQASSGQEDVKPEEPKAEEPKVEEPKKKE